MVENNNQISGQLEGVDTTNGLTHKYNDALTGILNNGQISLSTSIFGFTETLTGTFDGSTLTLNIPDSSGQLNSVVFRTATVDDYNQAVNTFETGISQQHATQQAEHRSQATQQAAQQAAAAKAQTKPRN